MTARSDTVVLPTEAVGVELLTTIRRLLDDTFCDEFNDEDWAHTLGGWHALVLEDDLVVSHAAVVARTLEVDGVPFRTGYVEGVATRRGNFRRGLGSMVMSALNEVIRERFELGALSTHRDTFYTRLGWEAWRGPTFVRDGTALRRTADEDDGVMVLRFGRSAGVDLTARISCEARPGDDW